MEMKRVMDTGAVGYLAVPNRWALVEPHFRLPFLSWLPKDWRSSYVRLMGRGTAYDCEPTSLRRINAPMSEAGFASQHLAPKAVRVAVETGEVTPVFLAIAPRSLRSRSSGLSGFCRLRWCSD